MSSSASFASSGPRGPRPSGRVPLSAAARAGPRSRCEPRAVAPRSAGRLAHPHPGLRRGTARARPRGHRSGPARPAADLPGHPPGRGRGRDRGRRDPAGPNAQPVLGARSRRGKAGADAGRPAGPRLRELHRAHLGGHLGRGGAHARSSENPLAPPRLRLRGARRPAPRAARWLAYPLLRPSRGRCPRCGRLPDRARHDPPAPVSTSCETSTATDNRTCSCSRPGTPTTMRASARSGW